MNDYTFYLSSSVLHRDIPVRMLIPDGNNLKCLILLHGYNGDHNQWCNRSVIAVLAEKHRLAVVMPCCGDGYYEDTVEDVPKFIGEELVTHIRTTQPISNLKNDLYLAGVSMGGFGSLLIGAKYSHQFGRIASLSGAFIIPDVVIGNQGVLGNADPNYFKRVFGSLENLEGSSCDPLAEAVRASEHDQMPPVYLMCGNKDILYNGNRKVFNALCRHGVHTMWYDTNGEHTWAFWNTCLPILIDWFVGK